MNIRNERLGLIWKEIWTWSLNLAWALFVCVFRARFRKKSRRVTTNIFGAILHIFRTYSSSMDWILKTRFNLLAAFFVLNTFLCRSDFELVRLFQKSSFLLWFAINSVVIIEVLVSSLVFVDIAVAVIEIWTEEMVLLFSNIFKACRRVGSLLWVLESQGWGILWMNFDIICTINTPFILHLWLKWLWLLLRTLVILRTGVIIGVGPVLSYTRDGPLGTLGF